MVDVLAILQSQSHEFSAELIIVRACCVSVMTPQAFECADDCVMLLDDRICTPPATKLYCKQSFLLEVFPSLERCTKLSVIRITLRFRGMLLYDEAESLRQEEIHHRLVPLLPVLFRFKLRNVLESQCALFLIQPTQWRSRVFELEYVVHLFESMLECRWMARRGDDPDHGGCGEIIYCGLLSVI